MILHAKQDSIDQTETSASDYIQMIQSKTKNNQSLTLTIFEKLFEELPMQIEGIHEALDNKHYDVAQEITHKLNGSASFCGLEAIQQAAHALESSFLNHDYANVEQQFIGLKRCTLHLTGLQKIIMDNLANPVTFRT